MATEDRAKVDNLSFARRVGLAVGAIGRVLGTTAKDAYQKAAQYEQQYQAPVSQFLGGLRTATNPTSAVASSAPAASTASELTMMSGHGPTTKVTPPDLVQQNTASAPVIAPARKKIMYPQPAAPSLRTGVVTPAQNQDNTRQIMYGSDLGLDYDPNGFPIAPTLTDGDAANNAALISLYHDAVNGWRTQHGLAPLDQAQATEAMANAGLRNVQAKMFPAETGSLRSLRDAQAAQARAAASAGRYVSTYAQHTVTNPQTFQPETTKTPMLYDQVRQQWVQPPSAPATTPVDKLRQAYATMSSGSLNTVKKYFDGQTPTPEEVLSYIKTNGLQ